MVTKIGVAATLALVAFLTLPSESFAAKKTKAYDPNWRITQPIPNMSAQFYRSHHKGSKKPKSQAQSN